MEKIYLVNRDFVKSTQAHLHPSDLGVIRGYAIFDYLRVYAGKPLFIDDYLDRFIQSAEGLRLELIYTKEEFKSKIIELVRFNKMDEAGIRMVLTGGCAPDQFSLNGHSNLIVMIEDFHSAKPEIYKEGGFLISVEFQRLLPKVKSTNYLYPIYTIPDWKEKGAEEILYRSNGRVFEASRSNIFMVKNGKLITNEEGILWGVTRKKVLKLAQSHYKVEIRPISYKELIEADEVFITSTTKKVMPITAIDEFIIKNAKPGKLSLHLLKLFNELEKLESR